MAGFNARTFTEAGDKELVARDAPGLQRLGTSTSGAAPTRAGSSRSGIVPMWDVDLAVAEVHRIAQEGLPVDQLPRDAARRRASRASCRATGTRCSQAHRATRTWCCRCTSAPGSRSSRRPPEAPVDHLIVLACQISAHHRPGPAVRPDAAPVPRPEGRAVGGRHRLDPVLLRPRSTATSRTRRGSHDDDDFGGQAAVRRVPRAHPRLLHHRPVGADAARPDRHRHHRLGVRLPAHRHDVAGVARVRVERVRRTPACSDDEIHKITWENACRFFDWDPFAHTPKEQATVGALRRARHRRRHHPHVRVPSGASATRPPASASCEVSTTERRSLSGSISAATMSASTSPRR